MLKPCALMETDDPEQRRRAFQAEARTVFFATGGGLGQPYSRLVEFDTKMHTLNLEEKSRFADRVTTDLLPRFPDVLAEQTLGVSAQALFETHQSSAVGNMAYVALNHPDRGVRDRLQEELHRFDLLGPPQPVERPSEECLVS